MPRVLPTGNGSPFDIDPSDPEAQKAATKIQAVFRGHQTRKSMKSGDNQEEEQLDLDQFDPNDKELCNAATKIQASFRGHMARKTAPPSKPEDELSKELQKLDAKEEEEELDIDLSDPDLHKAATKIQASFRGHKVRKEVDPKTEVPAASQ
ncbi:sperm surface protein Sp17 [Anabrus simplex]|uniref:sperm surface protein Sp17 n=1 Tax=Anabrus simplex TaxID=316456 RepID=UPI0034DD6F40